MTYKNTERRFTLLGHGSPGLPCGVRPGKESDEVTRASDKDASLVSPGGIPSMST